MAQVRLVHRHHSDLARATDCNCAVMWAAQFGRAISTDYRSIQTWCGFGGSRIPFVNWKIPKNVPEH